MSYTRIGGLLKAMPNTYGILQVGGYRRVGYLFVKEDGGSLLHTNVHAVGREDEWETQWMGVWYGILAAKKEKQRAINIEIEYTPLVLGLTGERYLNDEISKDYMKRIYGVADRIDWMGVRSFPAYTANWVDF